MCYDRILLGFFNATSKFRMHQRLQSAILLSFCRAALRQQAALHTKQPSKQIRLCDVCFNCFNCHIVYAIIFGNLWLHCSLHVFKTQNVNHICVCGVVLATSNWFTILYLLKRYQQSACRFHPEKPMSRMQIILMRQIHVNEINVEVEINVEINVSDPKHKGWKQQPQKLSFHWMKCHKT